MSAKTDAGALLPRSNTPQASPHAVSLRKSIGLCALYGFTSVSITFFNKAVFSVYSFNFPCFVTLIQILVCISFLRAGYQADLIKLPKLQFSVIKTVYPLTLCWYTYVVSGLVALQFLNVPMFSTLRKFTTLIVLICEHVVLKKIAPRPVWLSISVMVAGGLLAGVTDMTVSFAGYFSVSICCVSTALYLIMIVRTGTLTGLDTFGLLYYNNVLSLPLMLFTLVFFTSEPMGVLRYPRLHDWRFWLFLIVSAAQATLLNVAIFLCTRINSPLATAVTGQIKDIATVSLGLVMFGDVNISLPNLAGLMLALSGSMLYSYVKYRATVLARREGEKVSSSTSS